MYLFFDTETTGLVTRAASLQPTDPSFPRMMQLAAILLDENFNEIQHFNTYVSLPEHTVVDPRAQEAHGISKEICQKYGVPVPIAFMMFEAFKNKASHLCGHNTNFDIQMLNIECNIAFEDQGFNTDLHDIICTMQLMTPICKLRVAGRNQLKWPKLQEAYFHCFGKNFEDAHDALADVRASIEVYRWYLNPVNKVSQTC